MEKDKDDEDELELLRAAALKTKRSVIDTRVINSAIYKNIPCI